jgi:septum formation protein
MNRPADPIALASRSPRRYQLLCAAGYQVTVIEGALEPAAPTEGEAAEVARAQAWAKMPATSTDRLVIAADTVVVVDRQVLGKPVDGADAVRMLSALSGRTHAVCSAAALSWRGEERTVYRVAEVRFRQLSSADIERYVGTGEPMDKAGAYGIQGAGAHLVEQVSGSHTTVVGLPLPALIAALDSWGVVRC